MTPSEPLAQPAALTASSLPDAATARQWLAASPAAMAVVDADGGLVWANPACAALLGGLPADAEGRPLVALLDLGADDAMSCRALLAQGGEAEVQRLDDTAPASWLRLRASRLQDGSTMLSLEALDALKAERARADQQAELLDMARALGRIGAWERDPFTGEGRWDREVFRMRGMVGDGGQAPPIDQANADVVDADRPAFEAAYQASLKQPGNHAYRFRIQGRDGRVRQLESQWRVKHDAQGRPQRVHGLIMDDTEAWARARTYDEMVSQLALAVDLAGLVVWRHDLATDRVNWNRQGYMTLGLPPRADGMPLDEVRALVHPDDRSRVVASAREALDAGRPADLEARYRHSDGRYRTLMMRRVAQRDASGQPVAFIGVALDITERQDESRRMAELSRRFELATRTAGIGYWSLERHDERATWSAQLRAVHGLAPDAPVPTLAEWLAHWVHPEDRADVQRRFADWLRSGRSSLETRLRLVRADGEVRHVVSHSRVETGGRHPLLFGVVIDVSERHSAELALRQAAERAALAARGVGLGTWEVDLRDGTAYWDEQMWTLRGLVPRGEPPSEEERLALVHPEDREAFAGRGLLWNDEALPLSHEFRIVLPDGRVRWLASRSTVVRDEAGRMVRRIGVNWDVTDSRTAEAARQEREIAQRESQAKSMFLARMSHELRTPLNAVLGFSQLLLSEEPAGTGAESTALSRRRRIEHILAAGQHLLELINDVLDLSSLEGGEIRIALQPVPLAPLLAETLPLLEALRREKGVVIVTDDIDAVPMADATRLRQVLINLLTNAIKYNRPGGRVTVQAQQRGGSVLLRVSDTGRGLSDLQLRHLFEPFNRLGVEAEGIQGTGIGLAIVKALVERMGGSVHVDSEVGVGSVFELRMADGACQPPAAPPSAPPMPPNSRPAPLADSAQRARGKLLYVEDNPVNALIISELIARRADLQLHIAEDGSSGVRKALEWRPDLILLDMQLPDFDGHEVLRRLRADTTTASIPVIALSANAMPEDIDRALRAGMSDYWTKPLDFRAFMASIDALFGPAPARS